MLSFGLPLLCSSMAGITSCAAAERELERWRHAVALDLVLADQRAVAAEADAVALVRIQHVAGAHAGAPIGRKSACEGTAEISRVGRAPGR
jgi:hypothetical protein